MKYYPGQFVRSTWVEVAMWCNWSPPGYDLRRGDE